MDSSFDFDASIKKGGELKLGKVKYEADAWKDTAEEEALRQAEVTRKPIPLNTNKGRNVSYEVEFDGFGRAVFKPKSGEVPGLRKSISHGTYYLRECAVFRLDSVCGFGLVPLTVIREVNGEVGSVQLWVVVDGYDTGYKNVDRARMAALDYIIGNTDRHFENSRTNPDWRPAAIDNGLALPRDASEPLRSRWVHEHLKRELPPLVNEEVMHLSAAKVTAILKPLGIEQAAINGVLARLDEVQTNGAILGKAWPGGIGRI